MMSHSILSHSTRRVLGLLVLAGLVKMCEACVDGLGEMVFDIVWCDPRPCREKTCPDGLDPSGFDRTEAHCVEELKEVSKCGGNVLGLRNSWGVFEGDVGGVCRGRVFKWKSP